jgi:hypothetical protein
MGKTCSMNEDEKYVAFWSENQKETGYWEDMDIGVRVILTVILETYGGV